jgi:hypothetical protein
MAEVNPLTAILGPLGQATSEIIKLPMQLIQEQQPTLQSQIAELPEIIRLNATQFIKSLQEGPANVQRMVPKSNNTTPVSPPLDPISNFLNSIQKNK